MEPYFYIVLFALFCDLDNYSGYPIWVRPAKFVLNYILAGGSQVKKTWKDKVIKQESTSHFSL